jgi:hypothetical protein
MEFNNLPMGVGMTGCPTVGVEGMVVRFKGVENKPSVNDDEEGPEEEKRGNEEAEQQVREFLHWLGYLSDEKQQDARTSFSNSAQMLMRMCEMGHLVPNEDEVLYVNTDGCTAQYKCAVTLMTYIWLADIFCIPIDVMITAPYHGKSLVDALAGLDKNFLRKLLIHCFDSATRDAIGKIISQAGVCKDALEGAERHEVTSQDTKHKKDPSKTHVDERHYALTDYNDERQIPIKDVNFFIDPKQWEKVNGKDKDNKLHMMFQFYFHPEMPLNTCCTRRIACHCTVEGGCKEQITKPWDLGKPAQEQERFKTPPNCKLAPMIGKLQVCPALDSVMTTPTITYSCFSQRDITIGSLSRLI